MKIAIFSENEAFINLVQRAGEKHPYDLISILKSTDIKNIPFKELQNIAITSEAFILFSPSNPTPLYTFFLSFFLEQKKPIFMVIEGEKNIPTSKTAKTTVRPYELDSLGEELEQFVIQTAQNRDAKLFMIIPPEVNKYLEWIAKNTNENKSDIVRSAVLKAAEKDSAYQKFLADFDT